MSLLVHVIIIYLFVHIVNNVDFQIFLTFIFFKEVVLANLFYKLKYSSHLEGSIMVSQYVPTINYTFASK